MKATVGTLSKAMATLLWALTIAGCKEATIKDVRLEPQLVRVVQAMPQTSSTRAFTGVVAARVQSNLGFRLGGKVTDRFVDTGAAVKAGQPLMRLDPTDLQHAVTNALAAVAMAQTRVMETTADEARARKLLASGAISQQDYDHAKAELDSAASTLAADEAQTKIAQDNVLYADLRADSDGVIVETLAEPGQVVTPGQAVIKLAHAGPREALIDLPETVRPDIGETVQASLYNDTIQKFPAHLRELSQAADPVSRTYAARYVLDGVGIQAPLGATITVFMPEPGAKHIVYLPNAALYDAGKGPGVWIVDQGTSSVTFQPVEVAQVSEEETEVTTDISPEAKIVAMGAHLLHQGEKVRLETDREALK